MSPHHVSVFFYGSFINRGVLAELGLEPASWAVGTLPGFDLRVAPRANLVRALDGVVFGVLASATHGELRRLYAHAEHVLGAVYLPQAVLVRAADTWTPALCYLAPDMVERPAERAYVERILRPARELGFPRWYVQRIEAALPAE